VIVRKKQGDADGRGLVGIYVGFSHVVVGGIMVYLFATKRIVQKYTFVPREPMPHLEDIDVAAAARTMYGDILLMSEDNMVTENEEENNKQEVRVNSEAVDSSEVRGEDDNEQMNNEELQHETIEKEKKKPTPPPREHFTRSKRRSAFVVLNVSSERPPKPKLPTRSEARKMPRWRAAFRREIYKLNEEKTMTGLTKDEQGAYIRPDNAIVMRLLAVLEWKWKPDPDTGMEGWLECVRIVCDGSADKRENEVTYAETPDRTLLYLMLSVEATLGIKSMIGDAVRAYLNADSLDKNLVVIADRDMIDGDNPMEKLERENLLVKGLYGSTKGALSFQVWADSKLDEIGYQKCDVARGVYMKRNEDNVVRLYRHSDDFKISANDEEVLENEIKALQSKIRTTPFVSLNQFLGVVFARYDSRTMQLSERGDVYLATMVANINKLENDFGYLRKKMNPTGRVRYTPLPLKPQLCEEEMTEVQRELLPAGDIKTYMSLVMSMGWIIGNVRPNLKYTHHVLAKRLVNPRVWDLYLATWAMEHLILIKQWPLILGGPVIDPAVDVDASFASMDERRSVVSHDLRSGPKSGVIYANIKETKVAIKTVFEAETYAASDGQDTSIYARRVLQEMGYPSTDSRKVYVDNMAAIDWMLGSVPTKRSKHMEVRLYRARHLVDEGEVMMEHVPTEENIADLLTKSLPRQQYEKLATRMLGHDLIEPRFRFWDGS
jgi:hypothetical protein